MNTETDYVVPLVSRSPLDITPPPAAPFGHRIVSAKPNQISNFYTINWQEILGGWVLHFSNLCVMEKMEAISD